MLNGTGNHGENLMNYKMLTKNIIDQIIMTLPSVDIKLNVEQWYFKYWLGIKSLDVKDKLLHEKELSVNFKTS